MDKNKSLLMAILKHKTVLVATTKLYEAMMVLDQEGLDYEWNDYSKDMTQITLR